MPVWALNIFEFYLNAPKVCDLGGVFAYRWAFGDSALATVGFKNSLFRVDFQKFGLFLDGRFKLQF